MNMGKVLYYTLVDLARNRSVVAFAALVLAVSEGLFLVEADPVKALLSLVQVMLALVPLVSLILTVVYTYDTHEFTLSCELSDTRLYEFDATLSGNAYHILYWVEQVSATRVAGLMLVVPLTNRTVQVDLAFELYPELPTCSPAAA